MASGLQKNAEVKVEWLAGGGEMAKLIADLDWSKTPLGPLESWPQSLRTTVSLCLASNFPINIIWGEGRNQIYNDGYRVVCGAVHPRAMGEDYRVTWASAWPAIGVPFERAVGGETTYLENQRMFLERNGYPEETFFTFSTSPIRDEHGKVVGLFHPVTETTATMLAQRRTRALRDIADHAGHAFELEDACNLLLVSLRTCELDIPFALLFLVKPDGSAELEGAVGATTHTDPAAWPLAEAQASDDRLFPVSAVPPLTAGPYPEPITTAFVFTIRAAAIDAPLGYLVVGASTRLPLDEPYRTFLEMLGAAATAALANARAYEVERARAEALAELDRDKTAFFSNVSHEFRTPLTLLLGPIEDLLGEVHGHVPDRMRSELEVVRRNGLRLLKLVNVLLEFSRVEAGRSAASFEETDLVALTRDLASSFRSAIERAGIRFVVDATPMDAVPVDRDMWEKIVLNLLSNSFKFTKSGEIRVSLHRRDDDVELAVSDTGIGIPPTEIGRVFQRFHRVKGALGRTHEGSGIGLALVHDLAKLHGGTARVESVVGEGTTFFVRIPSAREGVTRGPMSIAPRPEAARQHASAFVEEALRWLPDETPADAPGPASSDRSHVLLADDNADMRDYVRRLLAPRYRVTAVANGAEALAAARNSAPDLVLSDLMMPIMDGAELVRRLRADESLRTLPIILLSARAGDEATAIGLELGADDYLTKPFAATELLARVATHLKMAALRRRSVEQEAVATHLTALVDSRDEFLSIASHELRTPLTALRLQVQLAERAIEANANGTLPADRNARMLRIFEKQVRRLSTLVDDLFDVGRIRSGQLELHRHELDLVATTRDTIERLSTQLAQAGCSMTFEAPPSCVGEWDDVRIEQVVTNLLENAIKYAPRSPVTVTVAADGEDARLVVRDHGPGVPRELRESIFARFERAHASRSAGGLGLGLFIARQVIDAHGGTIEVDAPPDGGARFVVKLPRHPLS